MASAAQAIDTSDATTICVNFSGTNVIGVNYNLATCGAFGGTLLWVSGPMGGTGPVGAVGVTGGTGGVGGTGPAGQLGAKGAQGPTGGTGTPGGGGGTGATGLQGVTGPEGPAVSGPTGGTGAVGDQGIPGPQGPTGAQGPTGPTAVALPGTIYPGCRGVSNSFCNPLAGQNILPAGPGKLGNTRTFAGNSQIILSCPSPLQTLLAGGANLLPADVAPGQAVRGILESTFPNPGNTSPPLGVQQWIITAEVTATSVNTNPGFPPAGPALIVDPYVICR
jgi:hypothetical protein